MFHVDSEVGRLRQVILHRPDLELKRLTPDNAADLLFDDVLWVSRAQDEHDAFADALRARGVVVHYYGDLLAQTLDIAEARGYILDRVFDPRWHGPLAAATLRDAMDGLDSVRLATFLAGGITKREIAEFGPEPKSIAFRSLDPDAFVLAPLPNLLYQRDTSCWIYGGVSVNAMRRRPGSGRPSPTWPSTAGTRCSPRPGSTSGTTVPMPRPPPSRAATSWSSATGRCWSG